MDPYAGTSAPYMLSSGGGIYKSTKAGEVWYPIDQGLNNNTVLALAIDPVSSNILYAGTDGRGIFKSGNGGQQWSLGNSGLLGKTILALRIDPKNSRILYAGTDKGVFKSMDYGATWEVASNGFPQ